MNTEKKVRNQNQDYEKLDVWYLKCLVVVHNFTDFSYGEAIVDVHLVFLLVVKEKERWLLSVIVPEVEYCEDSRCEDQLTLVYTRGRRGHS